jgi:flagellar hook-length control protein FliK
MLETNMHQLRNMFSPQQVVVEKQDAYLPQSQGTEKNMKDGQWDGQNQQSSDSSDEEKEKSDDDFAAKFQAVLMNEEV